VIAEILIVALVIALAAIIAGIVFGVVVIQPKSAYIPPTVGIVKDAAGQPRAISLYSRGGDTAYLDRGDGVQYALSIYVDTPEESYRADPDPDVSSLNPGQTLYIYWDDPVYRITGDLASVDTTLPPFQGTLRIVDENARLLVYKEGLATGGSVTVSPTPTCILGTGWKIWNRDTVDHTYVLRVHPSGPDIADGKILPKTERYVWYSRTTPYKATLTTLENGVSETRGSGALFCQFDPYDQQGPSANPQATLQLNPM